MSNAVFRPRLTSRRHSTSSGCFRCVVCGAKRASSTLFARASSRTASVTCAANPSTHSTTGVSGLRRCAVSGRKESVNHRQLLAPGEDRGRAGPRAALALATRRVVTDGLLRHAVLLRSRVPAQQRHRQHGKPQRLRVVQARLARRRARAVRRQFALATCHRGLQSARRPAGCRHAAARRTRVHARLTAGAPGAAVRTANGRGVCCLSHFSSFKPLL